MLGRSSVLSVKKIFCSAKLQIHFSSCTIWKYQLLFLPGVRGDRYEQVNTLVGPPRGVLTHVYPFFVPWASNAVCRFF